MVAGVITVGLGALVSWQTLGWDRPAWHPSDFEGVYQEIGELADLAKSNRDLVYQGEWWRLQQRILEVEAQLANLTPTDGAYAPLQSLLSEIRMRQSYVDEQLRGSTLAPPIELRNEDIPVGAPDR